MKVLLSSYHLNGHMLGFSGGGGGWRLEVKPLRHSNCVANVRLICNVFAMRLFTDLESGTTKDYIYGHLNVRYTFSMELRDTGKYGFLLPDDLIEPTAREAFEGIKAMILNMELKDY